MDIVYEGALFAERSRAKRVAAIHEALETSETWGEFKRKLPDGEWAKIVESYDCDSDDAPADDEPFDALQVWGYADGDYPDWLQQVMLEWFPRDLIDKYGGEIWSSVHNGDALSLPGEKAEEIADDLRSRGNKVERTSLNIR